MNVVSVLDAVGSIGNADSARRDGAEVILAAVFGEVIDPLREWIFNLECALDQAEYHARQLADTTPDLAAEAGAASRAACAQAHVDLVSALTFVVAEIALANTTRSGTYPAPR